MTSAESVSSVTIAVSRTPLSAPFYVARANGYFEAEGVDVEFTELVGGNRCLRAMLDGEADLATTSDTPVMFRSFERDDFAVVATFVSSDNDVKLVARRSAGISTPADLAGKRIGTVIGASSHFFLDLFLLYNEVHPESVEVVRLAPEEMTLALASGEVDAIAAWEPYGFLSVRELGDDAVLLAVPDLYRETFNLTCRSDFCAARPDAVVKVLRALRRATEYIGGNEPESKAVIAGHLGLDRDFIEWIWPDFHYRLSLDQTLLVTLEAEARWAIAKPVVTDASKIPDFLKLIDPRHLNAVDPGLVAIIH